MVVDRRDDTGYITPKEATGPIRDVSRIRNDPTVKHGLNLWVVSDQSSQGRGVEQRCRLRSCVGGDCWEEKIPA